MTDPPSKSTIAFSNSAEVSIGDFNQFIDDDLVCHRCTYNLRGLPIVGRCPECGSPVRVSAAGDEIHYCDPLWLAQVSRGSKVISQSLFVGVVLAAPLQLIDWISDSILDESLLCYFIILLAMTLYGAWFFSAPNPVMSPGERWLSNRRILRYTIVASAITAVLTVAIGMAKSRRIYLIYMLLFSAPLGLLGLVGALCLCAYCATLAKKVGSSFTVRRARFYGYGFLVSWVLIEPGMAFMFFSGNGIWACSFVPGIAGVLGFGTLILFLPSYLERIIEKKLSIAKKVWETALQESENMNRTKI